MADVFISYAREDIELVTRLSDSLEKRSRRPWVDWEGIEPSDEWWRSITEAIDGADAFAFVLSPHALASATCLKELKHAASGRKRIIAIAAADVEGLSVPPPAADVNWIFMRPGDDFEAGVDDLVRAMDLDLGLVRIHTGVLTRARAWDQAGRRPALLLRGEELRQAESWLGGIAGGAEPQPTELQTEFIAESRRRALRRQRLTVGGSLSIAAIAIALAAFALVQRSNARHQATVAQAGELAARSEAELGSDPEQSIALAARALRQQATPEGLLAMTHALAGSRLRKELVQPSSVLSLAFSPQGSELVSGGEDGAVRAWRVSDGRLLWSVGRGSPPVVGIAFARTGNLLAVARSGRLTHGGCAVEVIDTASGSVRRELAASQVQGCNRFVAFLGGGPALAIGETDGRVGMWNVEVGRAMDAVSSLRTPAQLGAGNVPGFVFSMAFSADGRMAAAAGNDGLLRVVRLPSGTPVATIRNQLKPESLAFSPSGERLLIGARNNAVVDLLGYGEPEEIANQPELAAVHGVAWSGDGNLFGAAAGGVDVWASQTARPEQALHGRTSAPFESIAYSPAGLLAGGASDGTIRIWAPDAQTPERKYPYPSDASPLMAGAAARANLAAVGSGEGKVFVLDAHGRLLTILQPHADFAFKVTSDGDLAVTHEHELELLDLRSGHELRAIPLPESIDSFAVSHDGGLVVTVGSNGKLAVVSGSHSRAVATPEPVEMGNPFEGKVEVSFDGSLVSFADGVAHPHVWIFRTSDLHAIRTEAGISAAFSPSGRLLAIQRPDLSISIIHTDNWRTAAVLRGATEIAQLSFSPDGRLLAASGYGQMRTWDTRNEALLDTKYVINEVGFSASNLELSPPALTAAGVVVLGVPSDSAVEVFDVCHECFNASGLLAQAGARLREISPVVGR
jgi:WD40 repeat protein